MESASFSIDWKALGAALGFLGLLYFLLRIRFEKPHVEFSNVDAFKQTSTNRLSPWPRRLLYIALGSFLLGFIDPHWLLPRRADPQSSKRALEGIAIYLVLDQSGSMQDKASGSGQPKIEILKNITRSFVQGDAKQGLSGRPNDLIGIVTFARGATVLAPLTMDHRTIIQELAKLQVDNNPEDDGTSIGYAIYKTASIIAATRHYAQDLVGAGKPAYDIKSTVIILVTDGLQDPSLKDEGKRLRTMDIPEAAAYAKEHGVRLYIVNVEPEMGSEKYAPNRHQMEQATELTGGHFYLVSANMNLADIYKQIDNLEKSRLPGDYGDISKENLPYLYKRESVSPYFIAFGMVCLLMALFLRATILKTVP